MNLKAVIWYLAFRPCLWNSLQLLWRNYNYQHRYPVIVFTFGPQYSPDFINRVHREIDPAITFIELPRPRVPEHIPETELFYHRTEIAYVRKFFNSPSRVGYLHAMHFQAGGFTEHPALQGFDWSLRLDDDAFILHPLPLDPLLILHRQGSRLGDMKVQAQNYPRVRDCQIGLRELADDFMRQHGIKRPPWDSVCGFGSFTAFDMSLFKENLWLEWWQTIQHNGGIYKFRWGDVEIHSLYLHLSRELHVIHNFDYERIGLVHHGGQGVGLVNQQGLYLARLPYLERLKNHLVAKYQALRHS